MSGAPGSGHNPGMSLLKDILIRMRSTSQGTDRPVRERPDTGKRWPCPCCGYLTLDAEAPGTYDICPVCFWEDDNVQLHDPDFAGGANSVSLRQAQTNFKTFGASDRDFIHIVRPPLPEEQPQGDHPR